MKKKMIKILACRVGEPAVVEEIDSGLRDSQEFVGGFIEMVSIEPGVYIVCNEMGKLQGLLPNRTIFDGMDVIAGNCFLCRVDGDGNCVSLTEDDIEKYKNF